MRQKLASGDVFEMRDGANRFGYGQIVRSDSKHFYISILSEIHDVPQKLESLNLSDVLLIGRSMDALIYHGRWTVIGNAPTPEGLPFPNAKVAVGDQMHIVDFERKILRQASAEDAEYYDLETSRAPIAYQNALFAFHGLGEMRDDYGRLFRSHVEAQAAVTP